MTKPSRIAPNVMSTASKTVRAASVSFIALRRLISRFREWLFAKFKKSKKNKLKFDSIRLSDIHCHERIGGLLKSYSRRAA
jgi:hypothetical protein